MRMFPRPDRSKIPIRTLLPDPFEKGCQRRRRAQRFDAVVHARELGIPEHRVHLLVTRFAQRRAVLGLAAFLFRAEMVLRDQPRRDLALTELTGDPLLVIVTTIVMSVRAARHRGKW